MELAFVMIMRTLLFPVDNGMGENLIGDGYAAEYDLWKDKIVWRQISKDKIEKHKKVVMDISMIASCLSPIVVLGILVFINNITSFQNGNMIVGIYTYAPIILGIVLFICFETLMMSIRKRYPIAINIPDLKRQNEYFKSMFDFTIRKNLSSEHLKTPYIMTYSSVGLVLMCVPFVYYVYLNPQKFTDLDYGYVVTLFVTSVFVSLVPNIVWNVFVKHIIYLKLMIRTKI